MRHTVAPEGTQQSRSYLLPVQWYQARKQKNEHHIGVQRCGSCSIYTTKIDGVVCPPNISETVAVRTVKLAHRPRIASTTIKFISKTILLSIL